MSLIARSMSLAMSAKLVVGAGAVVQSAKAVPYLPTGTAMLFPTVDQVVSPVDGVAVTSRDGRDVNSARCWVGSVVFRVKNRPVAHPVLCPPQQVVDSDQDTRSRSRHRRPSRGLQMTFSLAVLSRAFAAVGCALICQGAAAQGPNYKALLIGVSEYPGLPKSSQLSGPRNDVERLRSVLVQRGVAPAAITVLADGVEGAQMPTRGHILDQLGELARGAKPGDYIIITFAGHGSQVPVPAGHPMAAEEPDGLFEVFLPRDAQGWASTAQAPEGEARNVLYDHEIRAQVDRIAASGAFVWVIFDSCHSATMVRNGSSDNSVRLRQIPPEGLGIPQTVIDRAVARASAPRPSIRAGLAAPSNPGRAVYFYAAQTTEATPEMPLPAGQQPNRIHGLFTHLLAQTLEGGGGMTYRQLYQQVLARNGSTSQARSTPIAAGTQLDAPVLGQTAPKLRQWSLLGEGRLAAQAGALTDLRVGSIVAILPSAVAADAQALGYARVKRVTLGESELEPIEHEGKGARALRELATGAVARLVRPAPPLEFTVSVDLSRCGEKCLFDPAMALLKRASAPQPNDPPQLPIRWVGSGQAADVALVAVERRLWLLPPAMAGDPLCTKSTRATRPICEAELERGVAAVVAGSGATPQGTAETLQGMLRAAAKAENILRIASLSGQAGFAQQITTELQVERNGRRLTGAEWAQGCLDADPRYLLGPPSMASSICLRGQDRVQLEVLNKGNRAFDLTVLYIDSRFGVTPMYPGAGSVNRVEARASVRVPLEITDDVIGIERVVVFAVESPAAHAGTLDLSFLAQPSLETVEQTRSGARGEEDDAIALFRSAGFGEGLATRGVEHVTVPTRMGAQVFTWQVTRPGASSRP